VKARTPNPASRADNCPMMIEAARPARVAMPRAEYMMEILSFSAVESPSFE